MTPRSGTDEGFGPGSESEAEAELRPGDGIPGTRWRVVRTLGRGSHATAYEVTDDAGPRLVIKMIHAHLAQTEGMAERLLKEASSLAQLDHPNIVKVYRAGVTAGRPPQAYIAMELLSGRDGRQLLAVGTFDVGAAIDVLIQVASALGAAHAVGIVHQDLKIDNLFAHMDASTRKMSMKLLDFGIARVVGDGPSNGLFEGTVEYAAPEQLSFSFPVTFRADLYALGVIAFELLTGVRPYFAAEEYDRQRDELADARNSARRDPFDLDVVREKLTVEAPRLSEFVAVPPGLDNLVALLLSIHPDDRPGSASEVEATLRALRPDAVAARGVGTAKSSLRSKVPEQSRLAGTVAPKARTVAKRDTVLPSRAAAARPAMTASGPPRATPTASSAPSATESPARGTQSPRGDARGAGSPGTVVGLGASGRESERTDAGVRHLTPSSRPHETAVMGGLLHPVGGRERPAVTSEASSATTPRAAQPETLLMMSDGAGRSSQQATASRARQETALMQKEGSVLTGAVAGRGATELLSATPNTRAAAPATLLRHETLGIPSAPHATVPMSNASTRAGATHPDGRSLAWDGGPGGLARAPGEHSGARLVADTIEEHGTVRSHDVGDGPYGGQPAPDHARAARPSARLPLLLAAAGIGLLLLGGGIGLALIQQSRPAPTAAPPSTVPAPASLASESAVVRVVAVPSVEAEPPTAARAVPQDPKARSQPEPVAPSGPRGVHTRPAADPSSDSRPEAASPAANCNPNFTINDAGMKHFKAECFR